VTIDIFLSYVFIK